MPTLTQSQIAVYARAAGLTPPDLWAAVAMAESSGRTDVVNPIGCVGLWQINQPVHVESHPSWTVAYLKDPGHNAAAAKVVAGSQGLSAWEAYTNGSYKQYYNGSTTTPIASLNPFDYLGPNGGSGNGGVSGAIDGLATIAQTTVDGAKWISTPYNWVRIGYVVGGGILVIMGLGIVLNSTIMNSKSAKVLSGVATDALPVGNVRKIVKGVTK